MNTRVTESDLRIAQSLGVLRDKGDGSVSFSKAHVAKAVGVTYQSYSRMESGGVSFRFSLLEKFADFYGCTVSDITGRK